MMIVIIIIEEYKMKGKRFVIVEMNGISKYFHALLQFEYRN